MIENFADYLPLWMLLSAAFGFMIGDAFGNSRRHRKCLEQSNKDLRDALQQYRTDAKPIHRELRKQRGVVNDIHKRVVALVEAQEKRPASK